ncbi:hypothetical protein PVAG01_04390 [Phlyctema vagabunda]|uniref:Heterokaryon incompatibility domain-containing protein n=1 Tax=Phlyctema vagabunda TaxID=108571 RepID=A0ABR4PP89_9HELO
MAAESATTLFNTTLHPLNENPVISARQKILCVQFEFCILPDCPHGLDRHLLVQTTEVALEKGRLHALSYTWGEFDRRKVILGHDNHGRSISMMLGQEWTPSKLIARLAFMCTQDGPNLAKSFWIDQLCIPQNDTSIKQTLEKIPDIYRTFDVTILMPGCHCQCLKSSPFYDDASKDPDRTEMARHLSCLNLYGINSYFERLWTRQEFIYSRNVTVVWEDDKTTTCVTSSENILSKEEVDQLGPFLRLLVERTYRWTGDVSKCMLMLTSKSARFFNNAMIFFDSRHHSEIATSSWQHREKLRAFLLGKTLMRAPATIESTGEVLSDITRMNHFLRLLGNLATLRSSLTQPRDYVLAVWTDCPLYQIPQDYRSLSVQELLEDALKQVEKNFNFTLPAIYMSGLFRGAARAKGSSFLWRPTQYLEESQITDASYVYGSIPQGRRAVLPLKDDGLIALHFSSYCPQFKFPLSWRAVDFNTEFEIAKTKDIFDMMRRIVYQWNCGTHRVELLGDEVLRLGQNTSATYFRQYLSWSCSCEDNLERDNFKSWPANAEIDHQKLLYEITAEALGLDFLICKDRELRLAVVPPKVDQGTFINPLNIEAFGCVGLISQNVGKADSWWNDELKGDSIRTIRYSPRSRSNELPGFWIEIMKLPGSFDQPKYEVIGVWVPTKLDPIDTISGAICSWKREVIKGYLE